VTVNRFFVGAILLAGTCALSTSIGAREGRELQPLELGWEQLFVVDYSVGEYCGAPAVQGYVRNISSYGFEHIRVLVDELDAAGEIAAQHVVFVLGRLGGRDQLFFQVPVSPAAGYRARVFSYDRLDRKQ
jgi:hypothetical protein